MLQEGSRVLRSFIGKNICDVGCGEGLSKGIKHLANSVCGVDLQEACIEELKSMILHVKSLWAIIQLALTQYFSFIL